MKRLNSYQAQTLRLFLTLRGLTPAGVGAALNLRGQHSTVRLRLNTMTQLGLLTCDRAGRYFLTPLGHTVITAHDRQLAARRAERARAQAGAA